MDPDIVAKAFVEHYYRTFDTNRGGLGNLYQENSMLTFEGAKTQGSQAIVAKLTGLPFQQCQHNVSTVDCQTSGPAGGMLVFVSGSLQISGEQHVLKFSQVKWFKDRTGSFGRPAAMAATDNTPPDVPFDADGPGKLLRVE